MRATGINHVSIPSTDIEASARFYEELLGMERVPAPNFGFPVAWLRLGELQLHLFEVTEQPVRNYQHLGIEVDDFEELYRRCKARSLFADGRFAVLYELPSGQVQLYLRDPCDNLVEVNHPDVSTLDRSLFGDQLKVLAELYPQDAENLRARLFLAPDRQAAVA
jgi:catechol 2,3-dioxygenase-like lactoylglutathione lyase family enzyme